MDPALSLVSSNTEDNSNTGGNSDDGDIMGFEIKLGT